MTLANQICEACGSDAQPLSDVAAQQLLKEVPGWQMLTVDGTRRISKTFKTSDFNAAIKKAQAIAEIADAADHHPELVVEWGKIKVSWWTHSVSGLHKNDFIMAAKTDTLFDA